MPGKAGAGFTTFISDLLFRHACQLAANPMSSSNHDDAEPALCNHSSERAFACADRQDAGTLVPANGNQGMLPLLVVVAVAGILIEIECAVGTAINAKFNRAPGSCAAYSISGPIGRMDPART